MCVPILNLTQWLETTAIHTFSHSKLHRVACVYYPIIAQFRCGRHRVRSYRADVSASGALQPYLIDGPDYPRLLSDYIATTRLPSVQDNALSIFIMLSLVTAECENSFRDCYSECRAEMFTQIFCLITPMFI